MYQHCPVPGIGQVKTTVLTIVVGQYSPWSKYLPDDSAYLTMMVGQMGHPWTE